MKPADDYARTEIGTIDSAYPLRNSVKFHGESIL
jgi:hypothetical protein